jgi:ankyrin repeat protein
LHSAASIGDCDAVAELLQSQASFGAETSNKETPLHVACLRGHLNVFQLLAKEGVLESHNLSGNTPLHIAAKLGHEAICRKLLDIEARVAPRNLSFQTPLHLSAQQGHLPVCQLLIERGASYLAPDVGARKNTVEIQPKFRSRDGGGLSKCVIGLEASC